MEIEIRQHRPIAIRIVGLARRAIGPQQPEAIVELVAPLTGHDAFEQAIGMNARERQAFGLSERDHLHAAQVGPEHADRDTTRHVVRAQHRERIVMPAPHEGVDRRARQRRGHARMLLCQPP